VIPDRIHVFGASGSGTTSLASVLSRKYGHRHVDTDDFFWLPTDPPYQQKRPRDARLVLLRAALAASPSWVLSGSLCGWGDALVPEFELAVLLIVPTAVRLARLRARELQRYGPAALAPGGALHRTHVEFLDWAAQYDEGGLDMRSRALHDAWRATLPCPVVQLDGNRPVDAQLAEVEAAIAARGDRGRHTRVLPSSP